ncbi:MAG: histidine phosphatase family protein [Phycisphaerae bacterium]|nr:histidine phosphatase family protein [Phycisphaerae bacterium]
MKDDRPELEIRLVRHGESHANLEAGTLHHAVPQLEGDHRITLTDQGHQQARDRGRSIGADFIKDALVYRSPYLRTRQTLAGILDGAGLTENDVRIFEDPRLRELEHGFEGDWDTVADQDDLRDLHGKFFYRFRTGESPADCYDRVSSFLESMMRQVERKKKARVLIVSHGLTLRCFAMRFFHLPYEVFDVMDNPKNCEQICIAGTGTFDRPAFPELPMNSRWIIDGLRKRKTKP